MWFIGVEVEQETSAPPLKKILDPPLVVPLEKKLGKFKTYAFAKKTQQLTKKNLVEFISSSVTCKRHTVSF